eukprot:m.91279 g.91279  ORF g.91279 m.91279 type:complete len:398 (-) comp8868_c0_seq2:1071-2264(-)
MLQQRVVGKLMRVSLLRLPSSLLGSIPVGTSQIVEGKEKSCFGESWRSLCCTSRIMRAKSSKSMDSSVVTVLKDKEYRDLSKPYERVLEKIKLRRDQLLRDEIQIVHPWLKPPILKDLISLGRVIDLATSTPVSMDIFHEPSEKDVWLKIICTKRPNQTDPQDIELDFLFVDEDIVCINKQPGVYTQPTGSDQTNCVMAALHFMYRDEKDECNDIVPRNVHRLDVGTSGTLVVALNKVASRRLGQQFEGKQVQKIYVAIVEGIVKEDTGTITCGLKTKTEGKLVRQIVSDDGKWSESKWRVIGRSKTHPFSLVEVKPLTGRTHQIRAHLGKIGHPLLVDALYGAREDVDGIIKRIPLHCSSMSFVHPATGKPFTVHAPLLGDMLEALEKIGIPPVLA